jgi:DNA-binding NarL/FixJ family response regulator
MVDLVHRRTANFMPKSLKVLIAEDHEVVREGLKILISADPSMEVAGEAETGQMALRLAKQLRPDVIVMDLAMPRGNGLDAAREIRREVPGSKVLVLSAYKDEETVRRVLDAGASGYMTKHSAAEELLTAIREVGNGNSYYSSQIAGKLRARQRQFLPAGQTIAKAPHLTPREHEVLVLIARGQPNKEIAFTLGVSIKTVEKHRQSVMDKLDIHDIAGLTRYAVSKGLVGPPPNHPLASLNITNRPG